MSDEKEIEKLPVATSSKANEKIVSTAQSSSPKQSKKRRRTKCLTGPRKPKKSKIVSDDRYEIKEILRKTVHRGVTKYLVSWPTTWEFEENLHSCQELLGQFEAGLPQTVDPVDYNPKKVSEDWAVERILDKRICEDSKIEYKLEWKNSWVNGKLLQPDQVRAFEEKMKSNAMETNNNGGEKSKKKGRKRKRLKNQEFSSSTNGIELSADRSRGEDSEKRFEKHQSCESPQVIELELITLSEQREIDCFIDVGQSDDGSLTYIVKFKTMEYGIMKRSDANIKYPQEVIAFFERRIIFS